MIQYFRITQVIRYKYCCVYVISTSMSCCYSYFNFTVNLIYVFVVTIHPTFKNIFKARVYMYN